MKIPIRTRRLKRIFRLRNILATLAGMFLLFLLLDVAFPLPAEKAYSRVVLARDSTLLRAYLTPDEKWRMRTSLDEVPEELLEALVAKEDRWFWQHPGVNPIAMARAAVVNLFSGRRTSGASTITMQLARMMEPKARTWWSKIQESFRAFQLEWHYSKREILEMYLSYLPYGGNVEGVKAASYLYFDRPPEKLSLAQCALLAVIPNRPNSLRPDAHGPAARAARDKWLRRFEEEGIFSPELVETALREALPTERVAMPYAAPQFCEFVRRQSNATTLMTTLDPEIQHTAQQLLFNHVARTKSTGLTNGAVMVLDNATGEVLAYCGSADFSDKTAQGEVDAIQALRSPGSTLK
ncbi:MAG: transglycosylase domain-containing protein, partial [Bacteroidota bacterium]